MVAEMNSIFHNHDAAHDNDNDHDKDSDKSARNSKDGMGPFFKNGNDVDNNEIAVSIRHEQKLLQRHH